VKEISFRQAKKEMAGLGKLLFILFSPLPLPSKRISVDAGNYLLVNLLYTTKLHLSQIQCTEKAL
jgi:hypothetical protein